MRTALVTGATRTIGREIAIALANGGWQVFAQGRNRRALEELLADHGIRPLALDLTDRDEVLAIVGEVTPDLVVHATHRWPEKPDFLELDEQEVDVALEVNLSTVLHLARAALPAMRTKRQGAIIAVLLSSNELLTSMVSAAVKDFMCNLQRELSRSGVLVQAVEIERFAASEVGERLTRELTA